MEIIIAIILLFCLPLLVAGGAVYAMLIALVLLLLALRNYPGVAWLLLLVIGGLGVYDVYQRLTKTGPYTPAPPNSTDDPY